MMLISLRNALQMGSFILILLLIMIAVLILTQSSSLLMTHHQPQMRGRMLKCRLCGAKIPRDQEHAGFCLHIVWWCPVANLFWVRYGQGLVYHFICCTTGCTQEHPCPSAATPSSPCFPDFAWTCTRGFAPLSSLGSIQFSG